LCVKSSSSGVFPALGTTESCADYQTLPNNFIPLPCQPTDMTLTVEENTQLTKFRAQYLQLLDPRTLSWPHHATLKKAEVQAWLFKNLFDKQNLQYLPNGRYQVRVLKIILAQIEESIDDPDQDVSAIISIQCTPSSSIGLATPNKKSTLVTKS